MQILLYVICAVGLLFAVPAVMFAEGAVQQVAAYLLALISGVSFAAGAIVGRLDAITRLLERLAGPAPQSEAPPIKPHKSVIAESDRQSAELAAKLAALRKRA